MSQNETPLGFGKEVETKADGRYVVYYSFSAPATIPEKTTQSEFGPTEATTRGEETTDV